MSEPTALADTFVRDHLPPKAEWPELVFTLPELRYPERLNAAATLLEGKGEAVAVRSEDRNWSFGDINSLSNRIACVLAGDLALAPGNRVLLHGPNTAVTAACWLAILKAGGVAVATMPMYRARELSAIIAKGRVTHALCDAALVNELAAAQKSTPVLERMVSFGPDGDLESLTQGKPDGFEAVKTFAHDPALIAFSSGTTGEPKGCVHFHRDVLAMADTFSRHVLKPGSADIFAGTPPLSFTFGLGGLLVFPFHAGASAVLNAAKGIEGLAKDIARFRATTLFTSPTAYRALLPLAKTHDFSSLKACVSAGETLPKATSDAWFEATGIRAIDGIGATEMIHIFISASGQDIRPGATGKPVPGYRACLLDDEGKVLPKGATGRLAVKGPTGCRYLADPRQREYVQQGWNVTGDIYR
ncbi:MAG TPA: AMP-binding protein, partial [Sphingomonadales bacterium]|nr:AMP-binding protein [Sphingomonadales bacterium]